MAFFIPLAAPVTTATLFRLIQSDMVRLKSDIDLSTSVNVRGRSRVGFDLWCLI